MSHLQSVGVNIGCRVTDWDRTVSTASDILSHITGNGLDVWSSTGCGVIVDNLISREEGQDVGVVGKGINGSKDVLKVNRVVGRSWGSTVQGVQWCVDIEHQVNSCICQSGHTVIVVGSVVNGVDTNGVDTELLELCNITGASALVGNRIDDLGRTSWLIIDSTDVKSVVTSEESYGRLVNYSRPRRIQVILPFPLVVMAVRDEDEALGARFSTGDGAARAEPAAAKVAIVWKVFIVS